MLVPDQPAAIDGVDGAKQVEAGDDTVVRLAAVDPWIKAERARTAERAVADDRIVLDPVAERVVPPLAFG